MLQLVIDTNVFYDDLMMNGASFRLLLSRARKGDFKIALPEVVVLETADKYKERVQSVASKLVESSRRLADLTSHQRLELSLDVEAEVADYEQNFRFKLREAGADILDFPDVNHKDLVQRAIESRKPFKGSSKGYRDSLIWYNVLEIVGQDEVALISNNTGDFADADNELARELKKELEALGYASERVTLYTTLKSFVDENITPLQEAQEELQRLLDDELEFREETVNLIKEATFAERELLRYISLTRASEDNIYFMDEEVENLRIADVYDLENGAVVVDLRARARCTVYFSILKDEAYLLDRRDQETIMDWDAEDHYALGEVSLDELDLHLTAVFDRKVPMIEEMELVDIT